MKRRRRRLVGVLIGLAILVGGGGMAYEKLFRRVVPTYTTDEEHFKYGSIGNDGETGVPFAIWVALPKVFADLLPGRSGYASLGFRWEAGRGPSDTPLGFSRARVGVERIAINCAFCHITSYRRAPNEPLEFVLGGVSNTVDALAYQRFLIACARDPRFTPDALLPVMAAELKLSWIDRQIYRFVIIPATKKRLLEQGRAFAWTDTRPTWGPGRIDPFNPVKFGMLRIADDGTIGNSDMQAVWSLGARESVRAHAPLHWDGLNTSIREVVISSALGDGAVAKEFNWDSMDRIERFLRQTAPPTSPYKPEAAAVSRGRSVFERLCADCHDREGARTLTVIPVAEVGTDAHRVEMWTDAARDNYNNYRSGYDWGFKSFRNVEGYVSEPLTGLWLRAPYLHNGSVPTLADLLEPPEQRPAAFLRGSEQLDGKRGGFEAPPCEPALPPRGGFCFDVGLAGNGNRGHLYGTDLPAAAKSDLLAYLLTL